MSRDMNETVTGLAILIPCSPAEAMGEATFQMEFGGPQPVRTITIADLKRTNRGLKGASAAHFGALLAMRTAWEMNDHLVLAKAIARLQQYYSLCEAKSPPWTDSDRKYGEAVSRFVGLPPDEALKYLSGLRSGPKAQTDLKRLFSYEVSRAVGVSLYAPEIVLWSWKGSQQPIPAIYCPDPEKALYIHTFFIAPVGSLGFRACPYDGDSFFQRQTNQDYCCSAHREVHRMRRSRWRKNREKARGNKKTNMEVYRSPNEQSKAKERNQS